MDAAVPGQGSPGENKVPFEDGTWEHSRVLLSNVASKRTRSVGNAEKSFREVWDLVLAG